MPAIGDHYRPAGEDVPPGVYRVVGAADPVVLLRVGDADGRRANTGEIYDVDAATLADAFEPAENPDAGVHPFRAVRNAASGVYWQFRRFL